MNVRLVDKFVGHDGQSYFCRQCGRAGFKNVAAVRGHLGFCSIRKGGAKAPVMGVGGAAAAAAAAAALRGQEATSGVVSSSFQAGQAPDGAGLDRLWGVLQDISERQVRMEQVLFNELPHQLATVQVQRRPFDDNKWLKWVIVGYIAVWLLRKLGDDSVVKKAGSKIGDRFLGKAIDGLLDL